MTNHETAARKKLIEAMSAVSEDRTCCGWASDWARTLHAEGGIWETLGRAVGWPTGNYDAWVWVSWEEAARLYGHETSAAVSVPSPAPQAADRRARYAAAIAEGFAAFDADTTSDAYLDAELLDAVVAVADAEEGVTRADAQAAVLNRAADFFHGLSLTGTAVTAREVETELRRLAAEAQQPRIPRCPSCGHHSCDGDGPCGALLGVTVTSKKRCACPGPGAEGPGGPCVAGEQQNETPEAEREPDPDCEHCDGSGLDPDAYFVEGDVWTHAPCSECLPEDDDEPEPTAERVKHSGPETKFCVLCLSGEHERVDEPAAGVRQDGAQHRG